MKVVIQRTSKASVKVDEKIVGQIEKGLVVLVGIGRNDTVDDINTIIQKLINLRIFPDAEGKLNLSLKDINGSILSISQFTLYADVRKGRRPNFTDAAKPDVAEKLYNDFNDLVKKEDISIETGQFGAMMDVDLINDGPITIILESVEGKLL